MLHIAKHIIVVSRCELLGIAITGAACITQCGDNCRVFGSSRTSNTPIGASPQDVMSNSGSSSRGDSRRWINLIKGRFRWNILTSFEESAARTVSRIVSWLVVCADLTKVGLPYLEHHRRGEIAVSSQILDVLIRMGTHM